MKTLIQFLVCTILFSANAQNKIVEKKLTQSYKQVLDSINGMDNIEYENVNATKILFQKRTPGITLFKELEASSLKHVTTNARDVKLYSYEDTIQKTGKNSITVIVYKTNKEAEFSYTKILEVALEKSGVPGLTYTNDVILLSGKTIYWFNSNCLYSIKKHMEFVNVFCNIYGLNKKEYIECGCGEVVCNSIFIMCPN